jgi:hypothetical protein
MTTATFLLNFATFVISCHEATRILFWITSRKREQRFYATAKRSMGVA